MFLDPGLKQYVVSPTRITASSISLIDHVYSNDSNIDRVDVFSMLLSDHMAQHCSLNNNMALVLISNINIQCVVKLTR